MSASWRWAGACSIGTSHIKYGTKCQDRASCVIVKALAAHYLTIVVSDGAGSASHGALGAWITCHRFQRAVVNHLRAGSALEGIDNGIAASWLEEVRERIRTCSSDLGVRVRDFAATVVAAILSPEGAVIVHVGDGAAVLRSVQTGEWIVPSWPYHGEYASTTRFVTDDSLLVDSVHRAGQFDRVAVFSDGIEYLILDHRTRTAPTSFFDRLTQPVADASGSGRKRGLSKHLRAYLDSKDVCDATDDDKCLVIGVQA